MTTTQTLMPIVPTPRRKSDGTAYSEEDREAISVLHADGLSQTVHRVPYFELVQNGGVRQFVYAPFPSMVYRASADASTQGKVTLTSTVAQSEAHQRDLLTQGWHVRQEAAIEAHEQGQRDIARAAAETAAAAQKLSPKAQLEYRARSAKSPDHITE